MSRSSIEFVWLFRFAKVIVAASRFDGRSINGTGPLFERPRRTVGLVQVVSLVVEPVTQGNGVYSDHDRQLILNLGQNQLLGVLVICGQEWM
jgi:hypothetical protein